MAPKSTKKSRIRVIIRNEFHSKPFELNKDTLIEDVRGLISKHFKVNLDDLYLIYKGKRIKHDEKTLSELNIENDSTLYFINYSLSSLLKPNIRFPFNIHEYEGASLYKLFSQKPNLTLLEIQEEMQKEFMQNPALLKKTLEQPIVNTFINNADNLKMLLENNPFMDQLYAKYPKLRETIANPDLIKESTELAKNYAMLYELSDPATRPMQPAEVTNIASTSEDNPTTEFTVDNLLRDLHDNPTVLKNVINNPYFKEILKSYRSNPDKAIEICYESGLYGKGEEIKNSLNKLMPAMLDIFNSSSARAIYDNPDLLKCHVKMHLDYSELVQTAPDLYHNTIVPNTTANDGPHFKTEAVEPTIKASTSSGAVPQNAFLNYQDYLKNVVDNMVNSSTEVASDVKYSSYLDRLKKMGFTDTKFNIKLLEQFKGDISATISLLLHKDE